MQDEINTIDDLSRLIKNTMASKEDIQGLAIKEDINTINTRLDGIDCPI
jgi:hypothetical protein